MKFTDILATKFAIFEVMLSLQQMQHSYCPLWYFGCKFDATWLSEDSAACSALQSMAFSNARSVFSKRQLYLVVSKR